MPIKNLYANFNKKLVSKDQFRKLRQVDQLEGRNKCKHNKFKKDQTHVPENKSNRETREGKFQKGDLCEKSQSTREVQSKISR